MSILLFSCFLFALGNALPSEYLIEAQILSRKTEVNCEVLDRFGYQEEGKTWFDSCPNCLVCGAEEIGGALLEAQNACTQQTRGTDVICRSDCGCPVDHYRHNVTRQEGDREIIVEICISTAECSRIISDVKCPVGQIWDPRAPMCIRTCENSVGLQALIHPCRNVFWTPRCICPPERPIWHEEDCIRLSDCPK